MTVLITDPAEWYRIIANVQPCPLYISSDQQWFRNGWGMVFMFVVPS